MITLTDMDGNTHPVKANDISDLILDEGGAVTVKLSNGVLLSVQESLEAVHELTREARS